MPGNQRLAMMRRQRERAAVEHALNTKFQHRSVECLENRESGEPTQATGSG